MSLRTSTRNAVIFTLALTLTPAAALAATAAGADSAYETQDGDDDFDWGLLGLLGLAGLLGLKKKDDHRVDPRRNTVR